MLCGTIRPMALSSEESSISKRSVNPKLVLVVLAGITACIVAIPAVLVLQLGDRPEDRCKKLENDAFVAMQAGHYSEAQNGFKRALQEAGRCDDKDMPSARLTGELADVFAKEGDTAQAETSYSKAIAMLDKIKPKDLTDKSAIGRAEVPLCFKLAELYSGSGRLPEAESYYSKAIHGCDDLSATFSQKMEITERYANLLRRLHREEEAQTLEVEADYANRPISDQEKSMDNGNSAFLAGKWDEAENQYKLLLNHSLIVHRNVRAAKALALLGMCSLVTGNTALGKSRCERALKYCALDSDNASRSELAEVLSVYAVCQSMEGDDR